MSHFPTDLFHKHLASSDNDVFYGEYKDKPLWQKFFSEFGGQIYLFYIVFYYQPWMQPTGNVCVWLS